jgi:hypothetical protein
MAVTIRLFAFGALMSLTATKRLIRTGMVPVTYLSNLLRILGGLHDTEQS